jgi:limonene-1,2-epoxide hydrolase
MATPTQTVEAFLAAWDGPGGIAKAINDWFTPETVWENVGMGETTGPEQAMGVLSAMGGDAATVDMRVDNLAVASIGAKVLTERVDHIMGPDGDPAMSFRVMGIFEVADGKIAAWRDYFDTAGLAGAGGD